MPFSSPLNAATQEAQAWIAARCESYVSPPYPDGGQRTAPPGRLQGRSPISPARTPPSATLNAEEEPELPDRLPSEPFPALLETGKRLDGRQHEGGPGEDLFIRESRLIGPLLECPTWRRTCTVDMRQLSGIQIEALGVSVYKGMAPHHYPSSIASTTRFRRFVDPARQREPPLVVRCRLPRRELIWIRGDSRG